jgi:hypothetical protein
MGVMGRMRIMGIIRAYDTIKHIIPILPITPIKISHSLSGGDCKCVVLC